MSKQELQEIIKTSIALALEQVLENKKPVEFYRENFQEKEKLTLVRIYEPDDEPFRVFSELLNKKTNLGIEITSKKGRFKQICALDGEVLNFNLGWNPVFQISPEVLEEIKDFWISGDWEELTEKEFYL